MEPDFIPLFDKIRNSSLQHQRLHCTIPVHHPFPTLYVSLYTYVQCAFLVSYLSAQFRKKLVSETMLLILFSTLLVFY